MQEDVKSGEEGEENVKILVYLGNDPTLEGQQVFTEKSKSSAVAENGKIMMMRQKIIWDDEDTEEKLMWTSTCATLQKSHKNQPRAGEREELSGRNLFSMCNTLELTPGTEKKSNQNGKD